jgi:hypothetical protein
MVNKFYKKGCQEKTSASTGGEKIVVSRSSPLCRVPPDWLERGCSGCWLLPTGSSSGGDCAHRVLKLGKQSWFLRGNHGSIRGSWPIAISGYPRGHSV